MDGVDGRFHNIKHCHGEDHVVANRQWLKKEFLGRIDRENDFAMLGCGSSANRRLGRSSWAGGLVISRQVLEGGTHVRIRHIALSAIGILPESNEVPGPLI
ncbi:hypothetical protein BDR06DRAFT_947658 [Suillus hirtellus]|nr:hypothetical protein BDR06DRAFT_947658 [Suillus hirtellus]